MNYAFTNGKILDGTKDMQVQTGLCILVQDGTITDIVPDTADLAGYKTIAISSRRRVSKLPSPPTVRIVVTPLNSSSFAKPKTIL